MAPERDALLLVSLAHAVVAVAVHLVAGVAVVQVDVGGAVRAAAGAELGQVAGVGGLAARSARRLQLQVTRKQRPSSSSVGGGGREIPGET